MTRAERRVETLERKAEQVARDLTAAKAAMQREIVKCKSRGCASRKARQDLYGGYCGTCMTYGQPKGWVQS